eukprot:CAMPEP_0115735498 /NCGR_PEP_ID=MMETSP0272-20121206/86757_1 /TAXON_ID=71861 /ORGANISM="Scrippsiella trochoidea, Strain CCMP3099" /LENGTH=84 /DNA_ID=CAMNT_0003179619 /DNA_START=30 /DNA_END=281 /DNA_ORIENTATION=-
MLTDGLKLSSSQIDTELEWQAEDHWKQEQYNHIAVLPRSESKLAIQDTLDANPISSSSSCKAESTDEAEMLIVEELTRGDDDGD